MDLLKKYKVFFITLILVYVFIFGVYYFTTVGIANYTMFLQMRRYIPCAIAVALSVYMWKKSGYELSRLIPFAVVGSAWVLIYPICFWNAYHNNTPFIDKHYDQAFGAYIFAIMVLIRLLTLWLKKDGIVCSSLFSIIQMMVLAIPMLQIVYYYNYKYPVTESAAIAVLQTNKREAIEYLLLNFGYLGLIGLVVFSAIVFCFFSRCNNYKSVSEKDVVISNRTIGMIVIIVIAMFSYSQKMFFKTGVMQAYVFAEEYFDRANKFKNIHDDKYSNLVVSPEKPVFKKPSTIIMVIGESASRYYMSAYRNTSNDNTPWMRSLRENNNFIVFNHAYSSWGQTVPSLERALTEKNQYNNKEFNECITIVDIAKKAGYDTYWFSNQGSISDVDTPITLVAKTSNHSAWICDDLSYNDNDYKYDGDLLAYIKHVDSSKNNFIVLHLMGSHEDCINRYPFDFARFSEKGVFDMVLNYDDSLAYTDYILQQLYEYSTRNLNLQAMLYFSDHGGDPYRKRHPDQTGFKFLRIPMFIYVSDEYKELYPEAVEEFRNSADKYYTNDLNYELVCELLQIKSNHYNEENSILSKKYKFTRDTLTTNLGRTKLSEDKEEQ